MATNQSAVKKQDDWQDYTPAAGGGDGWQDYAPAKPAAPALKPTTADNPIERAAPKENYGFTVKNIAQQGWEGLKDVGHFAKEAAGDISNPHKPLFIGDAESGPQESTFHKYLIAPSERQNELAQRPNQSAIESIGHSIAAGIPGVGPWVAGLAEQAGTGDVGGAAARGATQYLGGKGLEKVGSKATSYGAKVLPMVAKTAGEVAGERSLAPVGRNVREGVTKAIYTPEGDVTPEASSAASALKHPTEIPGRLAIAGAQKLFPPPEPPPVYPGAPLPAASDFYEARGKDLMTRERQSNIADRQAARQAEEAERLKPVYPGAQLPLADEFYENRGRELNAMRRMQPETPKLEPVYPGAQLPSTDEFYENRGNELNTIRRMQTAKPTAAAPEPPAAEGPGLPKAQVVKLPVPREPVPTDNPGYMHSIPRAKLLDLARQGRPGAGQQLQNIGKTPLYVPESYPGPRPEGLQHVEPRYAYRAHDIGAPEKMDLERSHAHATLDPEEALRYKQGRNSGVEQTTSKNDLSKLKEGFDYELVPGPNGKQWVKYRTPRAKSEFEPHE